jgi:hypothetical protein
MSGGLKQLKGGQRQQARVYSDHVLLVMAKQGGWAAMKRQPKTLKSKVNLKVDYQAQLHSVQVVLMVVRQGSWTALTVAKETQGEANLATNFYYEFCKNLMKILFLKASLVF